MKRVIVLLALALVGCDASYTETSGKYYLPPELHECKTYYLTGDGLATSMHVLVCPNSTVTTKFQTSDGKHTYDHYTSVISK